MKTAVIRFVGTAMVGGIALCASAIADLSFEGRGDAVCVATVKSIDTGIAVPLIVKGQDSPLETIQCVGLHLEVEGSLVGDVPSEIVVLASERALKRWGYLVRPPVTGLGNGLLAKSRGGASKAERKPSAGARIGVPDPQLELVGFHGVFQLMQARPDGGFYRSVTDPVREHAHDLSSQNPAVGVARPVGFQYALSGFDDPTGSAPLYATGVRSFDKTLPSGLRLLDFLASDALSQDPVRPASLCWLANWHPLNYRSSQGAKTWVDDLPIPVLEGWFMKRFADSNLTAAQQADPDILCLRADWGDKQAYGRFRASALRTGKPSKSLFLPRHADADLVLYLAERADKPQTACAYFMRLAQCPERKSATIALAGKLLGRDASVDQGILECLYRLTGSAALNPRDKNGMPRDLTSCREEARKLIQAGQGK